MRVSNRYMPARSGSVVKLTMITIARWRANCLAFSLLVLITSSLKYNPLPNSVFLHVHMPDRIHRAKTPHTSAPKALLSVHRQKGPYQHRKFRCEMKKTDNCFRNRYAGPEIARKTGFEAAGGNVAVRRNVPVPKPVDRWGELPFNLPKEGKRYRRDSRSS